jgi:biotin carboxyl carrier protein
MAQTKITTEVSGRVCAIHHEVGASIGSGDDIAMVEAMKMEIPVSSEKGGTVVELLVAVDDMVEEGQVIAIVES